MMEKDKEMVSKLTDLAGKLAGAGIKLTEISDRFANVAARLNELADVLRTGKASQSVYDEIQMIPKNSVQLGADFNHVLRHPDLSWMMSQNPFQRHTAPPRPRTKDAADRYQERTAASRKGKFQPRKGAKV